MAILSKRSEVYKFNSPNSLNLSFTSFWGLRPIFVEPESVIESNSPDVLALCETNLDDSNDFDNFSVKSYLPLI